MDRLDRQVRRELGRFGAGDGDMVGIVEPGPSAVGRDDRAQRLAGAARPRRDAAREHGLGDVGVRARPARRRRSSSSSAPSSARRLRRRSASLPDRCRSPRRRRPRGVRRPAPRSAPSTVREAAELAAGSRTRSCANVARAAAASLAEGLRRPAPTAVSDTLLLCPQDAHLQGFFDDRNRIYRKRHHRPRGPRARPAAARDVHRLDGCPRASTTSSTRSSTTPSTRRSPGTTTRSRSPSIRTTRSP